MSNSRTTNKRESTSLVGPSGRLACDICRERKVRCDRADPKCGRCARLGFSCSYQGRKRFRASQAALPHQVSELQNRLAQAEAILKHPSAPTAMLPPQGDLPWLGVSTPAPFEYSNEVQNYETPVNNGFEGLEMPANLTEDTSSLWTALDEKFPPVFPDPFQLHDFQLPPMPETGGIPIDSNLDPLCSGSQESDEDISSKDLALLHQKYFEVFYPVLPILSKNRFYEECSHNPTSPRIRALSYGVALVGTTISSKNAHFQQACYTYARKYVELCERDDDSSHLTNLDIFQALLFIIRFELTKRHFFRAWMTIGRAVTLAQMLDLHHLDTTFFSYDQVGVPRLSPAAEITFSPMKDPASLEEMRRSFWALYIFESYASVRVGRPCSLEEDKLRIFLPSPGDLNEDFVSCPMPSLNEPDKLFGLSHISSYAAITIMVKFARLCFEHINALFSNPNYYAFWDRHYGLLKMANDYMTIFQRHPSVIAIEEDALSFTLHLNFYATHMSLHDAAIQKAKEQGLPDLVAAESHKCNMAAAFKILNGIRTNWPVQRSECDLFTIQATFIGWPLSMCMNALSGTIEHSGDATPIGIINSLRFLKAALDQVEETDGYWHKASAPALAELSKWDEQQRTFDKGVLESG